MNRTLMLGAAIVGPCLAFAATTPADTQPPRITGVGFHPAAVAVAGMGAADVEVNVSLTDATGVNDSPGPFVVLEQVSTTGTERTNASVQLALKAGTAKSGQWVGVAQVPSTWGGRWQIARVLGGDTVGNEFDVDPRTIGVPPATLTVNGTHRPKLTMTLSPLVVVGNGTLTMKGRATDSATGKGLAKTGVSTGGDNTCVEGDPMNDVGTNADGYWVKRFTSGAAILYCARLIGPPRPPEAGPRVVVDAQAGTVKVQYVVNAAPSKATVKAGTNAAVNGNVLPYPPGGGMRVILQRKAAGKWVNVNQAALRLSGRYTVYATPPTAGVHEYRVYKPGESFGLYLGGVSKTFTVRGT